MSTNWRNTSVNLFGNETAKPPLKAAQNQDPNAPPQPAAPTAGNPFGVDEINAMAKNKQELIRTLQNTRLDISGQPEDPNKPKYLDTARGGFVNHGESSWDEAKRRIPAGSSTLPNEARAFNRQQVPHADVSGIAERGGKAYTPFGEVSVKHLQPGEPPQPFTVEGRPGGDWLTQHEAAGGNPNTLRRMENPEKGLTGGNELAGLMGFGAPHPGASGAKPYQLPRGVQESAGPSSPFKNNPKDWHTQAEAMREAQVTTGMMPEMPRVRSDAERAVEERANRHLAVVKGIKPPQAPPSKWDVVTGGLKDVANDGGLIPNAIKGIGEGAGKAYDQVGKTLFGIDDAVDKTANWYANSPNSPQAFNDWSNGSGALIDWLTKLMTGKDTNLRNAPSNVRVTPQAERAAERYLNNK